MLLSPAGALASAAEDVLLVLRPDLVCSQICGKVAEEPVNFDFDPRIVLPIFRSPSQASPVFFVGEIDGDWQAKRGLSNMPLVRLDSGDPSVIPAACSGLCITLPPPPRQLGSFLNPSSLPRSMNGLRAFFC